ncbi:hypothetical protein HZU73_00585 [Apis mellifera caucasica]|nr:hypothetical protein HZU73_00585 [Apis mellifera caucasica]
MASRHRLPLTPDRLLRGRVGREAGREATLLVQFVPLRDGGGGNGGGGGGGGGGCEISHGTQWMLVSFFLSLVRIPPLGLEVSHGGYHGGLL